MEVFAEKSCVDQNILRVMEKHDEITFPHVLLKIKLLSAFCNVSKDWAFCMQRKILIGLSCTEKQTKGKERRKGFVNCSGINT